MDGYTDGCKIKITTYNPEKRGRILDRNGNVLATSVKVYNLVIDSKVILSNKNILNQQ